MPDLVAEGSQNVDVSDNKHPETISWTQYIGVKEMLSKAETKAKNLEEQMKQSPKPEEFTKTKAELEAVKAEHAKVTGELKTIKDQSILEKRNAIIAKGVPADKVKDLSEKELDAISGVLGTVSTAKPKPDMSGGGGGNAPVKASDKIRQGFASLHPNH